MLITSFCCQSQTKIKGTVKDSLGNKLAGAAVYIKNQNSGSILNYDISDSNGLFSIDTNSDTSYLVLSVSYLGFKNLNRTIANKTQNIEVVLIESIESLREVLVKADDIRKVGDTLSYSVSAFKDQKDRSIADVLKKMPGIEILSNGQILYMGQPIEKYYIEGMDMLEGRYNLANDNISAEDVSKVQILENHQPIKILDSLVFSDRASLNIKLKNNVSITGAAEMGAGFSPILFQTNITPLIFTKKSQALISYQFNNAGKDLERNNKDFSTSDNLVNGFTTSKKGLLSINQLSRPSFATARWLDNSDHLGNVNYLHRLKNKTDLKVNLSYLNGAHRDRGTRITTYKTDDNKIVYREQLENIQFLNSLNSKLTWERNLSKSYLRNSFAYKTFWDSQRSSIDNNVQNINQNFSDPYITISNELKIIQTIGKQLVTFKSNTGYTNGDQNLMVFPLQFAELLNEEQVNGRNRQTTNMSTFFTENSAGFTKKLVDFVISPTIGIAFKRENLSSNLLNSFDDNLVQNGNDYINDLQLSSSNLFISNQLNFKKNNWLIVFSSPLYIRYFKTENRISNYENTINRLNFEPNLSITKKLSPYWEATMRGAIENRYGEIDNLFDGYILRNYISLIKYNTTLQETKNYFSSVSIRYRNALKAIFARLSFSISKNTNNLLYSNTVSDNGALIIESIIRDNSATSQTIALNASKYFKEIETTLTLGSNFSYSERPQIVNGFLGAFLDRSQKHDLAIETKVSKWFSVSGSTIVSTSKLQSTANQISKVKTLENSIKAFFYFNEYEFFIVNTEHYYNRMGSNNNNNYFLNLSYQFTSRKYGFDTEIIWNNVLNTNEFINVSNNEFFTVENSYILRPSQLVISLKFSL